MKNENSNLLLEVMRTLKKGKRLTDSDLLNIHYSLNKIDPTKKLFKVYVEEGKDLQYIIASCNDYNFVLLHVDRHLKYVVVFCNEEEFEMPAMKLKHEVL